MNLTSEQKKTIDSIMPYIVEGLEKGLDLDSSIKYAFKKSIGMLSFMTSEEGKDFRAEMMSELFHKINNA